MSTFWTDIGLEIHVQLKTETKAFSGEQHLFGAAPNSQVSELSLALPGTLPTLNKKQLEYAIKLGLACQCQIHPRSSFDRKNYVYPDLPKSYQITQDHAPICLGGEFSFFSGEEVKTIRLHHIHMEEDAGKSIHDLHDAYSLIDLNRAGTPLLEVVTEPDFHSSKEVYDFIDAFQVLLRHLEISDANMEEGSLRADCNVSIRKSKDVELGTRTEIKNINSKKFARQAIEFEIQRQSELIESGHQVDQETRLFDPAAGETYVMRKKEDALDYRYFPEPDMCDIHVEDEMIETIKQELSTLPFDTEYKLVHSYGISYKKAAFICRSTDYVNLFSLTVKRYDKPVEIANFIANNGKQLKLKNLSDYSLLVDQIIELLTLIEAGHLSASNAYKILVPLLDAHKVLSVKDLAENHKVLISSNKDDLESLCLDILKKFPDKKQAYKNGNTNLMGFFMGQFMRQKKKAVQPQEIQNLFEILLNSDSD